MPLIYKTTAWLFLFTVLSIAHWATAATVDELREKIFGRQKDIEVLEAEIASYQKQLQALSQTGQNLQQDLKQIDTSIKKLAAEIKVTENKIAATVLNIERLNLEIAGKQTDINSGRRTLSELLRQLRQQEETGLVERVFADETFAGFLSEQGRLLAVQGRMQEQVVLLQRAKITLEERKEVTEQEKIKLEQLQNQLADQQEILSQSRNQKSILLQQTKNQEAGYTKLLEEKTALRDAFLKELFEYESRLRFELDPTSLPPAGTKVLSWPLDQVFITQYFGKTADSRRLYLSGTHNGIDLRASPGTPVKAAASGRVTGVGDTDLVCRGASYGKWVLIKHINGLSTLYAHLSLIKVVPEQVIAVGDIIGYSGSSGYATGPHLHFTVFASAGVEIGKLPSRVCRGAVFNLPVAAPPAYLDPIPYLP